VILGPLSVAISSASYAKNTKDAITATYLAHEGIELVRFKRDSTYVECQNNATTCVLNLLTSGNIESVQQGSWRIFKERMRNAFNPTLGLQPSCFTDDNTAGCAFDIDGIINTGSDVAERVTGEDDRCDTLYTDNRQDQTPPPALTNGVGVTDRLYLCKEKGVTYNYFDSGYKRTVKLTSSYIPVANQYQKDYEDDVRIESVVTYTRGMGLLRTIRAVDYFHARP
jgi:hypothetical protein